MLEMSVRLAASSGKSGRMTVMGGWLLKVIYNLQNLQFMLFYIVTPLFYLNWLRSGSAPAAKISTSAWLLLAPSSLSSFSGLFTWVFSCLLSW